MHGIRPVPPPLPWLALSRMPQFRHPYHVVACLRAPLGVGAPGPTWSPQVAISEFTPTMAVMLVGSTMP